MEQEKTMMEKNKTRKAETTRTFEAYGKVVGVCPEKEIKTKDGRIVRVQECVFEYGTRKWPNRFGFVIYGDKIDEICIKKNDRGYLLFDLRGKEFPRGSYSCSAIAWKFETAEKRAERESEEEAYRKAYEESY